MKRLFFIAIIALSFCASASAQHNLRTGYFLDGYTYRHKLNPAFGGDRGYFAIPILGYTTLGVESNLALSTLLYPTGNGNLTTFLSPMVSADDFLSKIHDDNPLNVNADISLFSLGFNAGKSFHTIDMSVKADARANVPGALFSWTKKYGNLLDMSSLGFNMDSRVEVSYGYSRPINDWIRIGAKVKLLAGAAKAEYSMEQLTLTMQEDMWRAVAQGKGYFSVPGVDFETEGRTITGINMSDISTILDKASQTNNYGFAVDLGITMEVIENLIVSASVTDLGFINWQGMTLGSENASIEHIGFEGLGESADIKDQLIGLGNDMLEIISPEVRGRNDRLNEMLSMTAHVGVEYIMPFWDRLSVGALGTYRFDGPYSWWEARGSINLALFNWFSLTGNYAHSTFGGSYGAAINFHPNGINFFVGVDSYKPALNMTKQYVPIDSFNTTLAIGLNFAFGGYHGRFDK